MRIIKKYYDSEFFDEKSINSEKREVDVIISSETMDRDLDVVRAGGIKLENYRKNPIVLWSHDSFSPPIGKALEVKVVGKKVVAKVKFADNPIWELVKDGFIKSISIGFSVLDSRFATKNDRAIFGKELNRVINKSELIEFSFVNVPSNVNAVVTAVHKGIITSEKAKEYFNIEISKEQLLNTKEQEIKDDKDIEIKKEDNVDKDIIDIEDVKEGIEDVKEAIKEVVPIKSNKQYNIEIDNNKKQIKQKYKIEILRKKGQIIYNN